jgi:Holliday junction resolvase RusA-like endonuclease
MPEKIELFEPCVPPRTTAQMKRVDHKTGRFFRDAKARAAVATFEGLLMPHRPAEPVGGAVSLTVEATWPWRASDLATRARRAQCEAWGRVPCTTKPDLDNWVKQLQDCLVSLRFIEADERVAELVVRKYWGACPGIRVVIAPMETTHG